MVFYTPMMVTVATSLELPIKLVFPGSKRGSMLGLGDIILPGIVMALALRFDLYLHYLCKTSPLASPQSLGPSLNPKPTYVTATGRWGERLWTLSLPKSALPSEIAGTVFPKVYFYASIIGYVVGMITTLTALNIFSQAQPALLYLVPSILIALWGTALCRGELRLMWNYTEAGSDEGMEKVGKNDNSKKGEKNEKVENDENETEEKEEKITHDCECAHYVFFLSLSRPRNRSKKATLLDQTG